MEMIKTDLMVAENLMVIENVLGEQVQIYVGPNLKKSHAWEDKDLTKDCKECPKCIDRPTAIDIINVVGKKQNDGWISPLEERILGICVVGICSKVLAPPTRTTLGKCPYFKNGHGSDKRQAIREAL